MPNSADFTDSEDVSELPYTNISEYNQYLVDGLIKVTLKEYADTAHKLLNPEVSITTMEYLLSLCTRKYEFIITTDKLVEFGVLKSIKDNHSVKKLLIAHEVSKKYYKTFAPPIGGGRKSNSNKQHGGSNKEEYMLTQIAFKLCLLGSKNTKKKYSRYYLFIEEVFDSYVMYEFRYKDKLILIGNEQKNILSKKLDDQSKKMDEQSKKMDYQSKKMDDQSKEIQKLISYTKNTNTELSNVTTELVTVNTELSNVNNQLVSVNNQLFTATTKIDNLQDSINRLIVNISNYSNLPIVNDRSLSIIKMIRFFNLQDDGISEWVNLHVMYYSMNNSIISLKKKFTTYNLVHRTQVNLLGTTHPINDSMNCMQQLTGLYDVVIANLDVNPAHVQLFQGINRRRRILRVRRDIAQDVVNEFITQINAANVLNEIEALDATIENNLNVNSFYQASDELNTRIVNRFKNDQGMYGFNIVHTFRNLIEQFRNIEIDQINNDPDNNIELVINEDP